MMKRTRDLRIAGQCFAVPPRLERIDGASTHGWQVRYLSTRLFSDGAYGPQVSFNAALAELTQRYAAVPPPPPPVVRIAPMSHKRSSLPVGISGPVLQQRAGRAPWAELKVCVPLRGCKAGGRTVYIATEATWSVQRWEQALAKAVRIRDAAVERV